MLTAMLIIATIAMSTFYFPTAKGTDSQSGWIGLPPMPTARGGLGVAVVNGKIYAIGGLNGDKAVNNNEMYDPISNQWTVEASMPTARSGFATAVYDNKIYIIGGTVGTAFVANNEVYDPATNTWETEASMPTPRADLSASVINDQIYLIGGKKYSNNSPYFVETNINEVYDPANNTWSSKASIPTAVFGYASTVFDGKIYVIGGSKATDSVGGSSVFVQSDQVYDPQTNTWSLGANLPSPAAYGAAAATVGYMAPSKLYFIGGYFSNAFSAATQVYNQGNNSWTVGDPMPTPRAYLGVAAINDVLYAIGGFDGQNWLNTNEEYKPVGYGTVPPNIEITSPENKTYSNVTVSFAVNRGTDWIGYSLDNQANVTIKGQQALLNVSQGEHSIILYGNDSLGNMGGSSRVFFSVDTTPPVIEIVVPQNKSYSSTDIQLTFILNEQTQSINYSLDGQAPVPIVGNVTLPALTTGSHKLTLYATDEVGNSASKTVYFTIEPFPTLTVVAVATVSTIALASAYLFVKVRKKKPN